MTASDATAGRPLPGSERIEALDALRGFALLGIFIANMPAFAHSIFAAPPPQNFASIEGAAAFLRDLLVAGKFNLLFGFCFGVGFALQLRRLEASPTQDAAAVYRRRLVALLAIGLLHSALLWMGDALVAYAIAGFILLALRRAGGGVVVAWVVLGLAFPALLEGLAAMTLTPADLAATRAEADVLTARNNAAYGSSSMAAALGENLRMFAWLYASGDGLLTSFAFVIQLGTGILVGWWVGRRGFIERLPALMPILRRVQIAALAVAVTAGIAWWLLGGGVQSNDRLLAFAPALARSVGRAALAAFYAVTVLRLATSARSGAVLRPLAIAGRMPLSNYLLQTALGIVVFHGWALGWWNRTSPAAETLLAIAIFFVVQLPLSAWWLSRFRFGPIEWLWRRLTYGSLREARPNAPASNA